MGERMDDIQWTPSARAGAHCSAYRRAAVLRMIMERAEALILYGPGLAALLAPTGRRLGNEA
jgi:hypothetical protein